MLRSGDASIDGILLRLAVRRIDGGVLFSSSSAGWKLSCDARAYLPLLLVFVDAFANPDNHWDAIGARPAGSFTLEQQQMQFLVPFTALYRQQEYACTERVPLCFVTLNWRQQIRVRTGVYIYTCAGRFDVYLPCRNVQIKGTSSGSFLQDSNSRRSTCFT